MRTGAQNAKKFEVAIKIFYNQLKQDSTVDNKRATESKKNVDMQFTSLELIKESIINIYLHSLWGLYWKRIVLFAVVYGAMTKARTLLWGQKSILVLTCMYLFLNIAIA